MVADQVENFIGSLIEKTEIGLLKWKKASNLKDWDKIRCEAQRSIEVDFKDYIIDDKKSYGILKDGGYLLVLNTYYVNAAIFSPTLDKYALVIKINVDFSPINLSNYAHDGFKGLMERLNESIEVYKAKEYEMPDCLYDFLDKMIGNE